MRYTYIKPSIRIVNLLEENLIAESLPTSGSGDPTIDDPNEFEVKGHNGSDPFDEVSHLQQNNLWEKGW